MKKKDNNPDRKQIRRDSLKHKFSKKEFDTDDNQKKQNFDKKQIKKLRETMDDDEWEDWERYYNH